jgi:hypothetical protein
MCRAFIAAVIFFAGCLSFSQPGAADIGESFARYGSTAVDTLEQRWYADGRWRLCLTAGCPRRNEDWGADALTYDLYLRWKTTHEAALVPYFARLAETSLRYGDPCAGADCRQWSDVPAWDALANLREYGVTDDDAILAKAQAAYDTIERSSVYARGACPEILYQLPFGRTNKLKTLETDSNLIRAALLLYRATADSAYLTGAVNRYAAVRQHYLDADVPLYTVYVFDDGTRCKQLRHRFFASVNGNMIEAGIELSQLTEDRTYLDQAIATAQAVADNLADARGIFANLQAENDVAEPLVEAMYDLARADMPFAREWILRNAEAAASARTPDGSYGRFFDGPPPVATTTAWQTNGGFALMIAAAALEPERVPVVASWADAGFVDENVTSLPATIRFTGSSIALIGAIGERCCEAGHARVLIDGEETFHRSGIWQNKSSSGLVAPQSVLFAWRWPNAGTHVLSFLPADENEKEGGSFLHLRGYILK